VTAVATLEVHDLTMEFSSGGYKIRPLDGLSFDALDGQLVVLICPATGG
jgi:putative ABC transport system ATP-binding protein